MPDRLFGYRLAAKLGIGNVAELVDSLSDEDWQNWQAVAIIDGWWHGWQHTGELVASIANLGNRVAISASSKPRETHAQSKWLSGADVVQKLTQFKKQTTNAQDITKILEARERRKARR